MTTPTLIPGMAFGEYCDLSAVNATTLLTYKGTIPARARHRQLYDIKQTTDLVKGHATHAAVLEPKVFERDFAAMPRFGDFRTKAAREQRDQWLDEHKSRITLTPDEYAESVSMRDAVMSDPATSQFFTGKGQNELTLTWTDDETGLACKARVDRVTFYHNYPALVDLKTARGIDDRDCEKAIATYNYHIRMAWYLDALMAFKPGDFRVFLVWVEKGAPYFCRYTELEDDPLREGRLQYRKLLNLHAECLKANHWQGYPEGLPVGIPNWAYELSAPRG